ncbi:FecR domain-containing protein [Breoghania sp.]|uniref:FecR family protein n=1 Tax=Breoghania sp. TaxID=2065378 RepID=UPI002631011E|nr:FecR domain-containing protein [Breoghania sp.]MDJ0930597.1 hypothetical protein [Breoghania sp.]
MSCVYTLALKTGERVRYTEARLGKRIVSDPTVTSWRNGLLIFDDQPLGEVVADLNRHRRGKVIVAGNGLRALRVSGVFHLNRPQEILTHLEKTLGLDVYGLAGGLVVLHQG